MEPAAITALEDARRAFENVRLALLDMDGTFYRGDKLLPRADEFLRAWTASGRDFLFLTNNSSKSAAAYVQKLGRMGVRIGPERVLTSGQAAAMLAQERYPAARAYVMGTDELKDDLRVGGVRVVGAEDRPDIVIAGYDTTLTYRRLAETCDLVRAGLPFIATHPDVNCPTETGTAPDLGSFIELIASSAGRRPDAIAGKPYAPIVEAVRRRTGVPAGQMAMFGDRLTTDIPTGVRNGMTAVLVLTGEATLADVATHPDKPHVILPSLASVIECV